MQIAFTVYIKILIGQFYFENCFCTGQMIREQSFMESAVIGDMIGKSQICIYKKN